MAKSRNSYSVSFPDDRENAVKEAAAKMGLSVPLYIRTKILELLSKEG